MSLTLADFAAVAGSTNSRGDISLFDNKGNEGIQKFNHHIHLTSLNNVNGPGKNQETRSALFNAICHELDSNGIRTTERSEDFLNSVYRQLGLNGNVEVSNKPLDRRTVRALVRATQLEIGTGVKFEKATACGKALASFLSGKTDGTKVFSGVLLGLMKGIDTLQKAGVSDVWIEGEKPGESFHLQKSGNGVFVDCGGATWIKLPPQEIFEKAQLALVGKNDLPSAQRRELLAEVEKRCFAKFPGIEDIDDNKGSPDVMFARKLSEKSLLTQLGGGGNGLKSEELRNVPSRMMFILAKIAANGITLSPDDVRQMVADEFGNRFNAEDTLEILDMYQKADNKESIVYAEEVSVAVEEPKEQPKAEEPKDPPKVEPPKVEAPKEQPKATGLMAFFRGLAAEVGKELKSVADESAAAMKATVEMLKKEKPKIQAMMADVVSDERTFLADQHTQPGARLQVTLSNYKETLAKVLIYRAAVLSELPKEMVGTVEPLVSSLTAVLCKTAGINELPAQEAAVKKLLDTHLSGPEVRKALAEVDVKLNEATANLCTKMQYQINHSFAKVFAPTTDNVKPQGLEDRYDELIDLLLEGPKFSALSTKDKDSLLAKIDDFVDRFAKAGGSERIVGSIIDEVMKRDDVNDLQSAEKALQGFFDTRKPFAELAEKNPNQYFHLEKAFASISKMPMLDERETAMERLGELAEILKDLPADFNDPKDDFGSWINSMVTHPRYYNDDGFYGMVKALMVDVAGKCKAGVPKVKAASLCEGIAESVKKTNDSIKSAPNDLVLSYFASLPMVLADIKQPEANQTTEGVKNLVDFMKANGMAVDEKELLPTEKSPDGNVSEARLKRSRELLTKLGGGSDLDKGYGLFMTKVMRKYVNSMSIVDRRAMFAAGIRFNKEGSSEMQALGAFLKGAGPIMQKMLQGFASMDVDKDFLAALSDMKSNLPDIADDVVKANLLDMVNRSNGQITGIEMKKKLGAASVGQAFLCTVKKSDGTTQDVVVKMLRPEAEQRADREKGLFIEISKEVPGMEKTFAGQLESILDELDLRKEAENTKAGSVYDEGGLDVKSMKLLDVIAPTKYTMVVEKAPGTTVDRLIKDTEAKFVELTEAFYKDTVTIDADGKEVKKRVVITDAAELKVPGDQAGLSKAMGTTIVGLSRLYEETLVQQQRLVALASKWTNEGIFKGGFYHGDLHAGNIMVDDKFERDPTGKLLTDKNGGLTVIDYGNATRLTKAQQKNVIRMMTAASVRDTNVFMKNFAALMSPEGRVEFEKPENWKANHDLIHNIFNLGTSGDSADRIFAVLQQLQLKGFELPGPIFKFSQCSIRLQGTIQQMNDLLNNIRTAMKEFRSGLEFKFVNVSNEVNAMDLHGQLIQGVFKNGKLELGESGYDFEILQNKVDEKLALLDSSKAKSEPKKGEEPLKQPSEILRDYFKKESSGKTPPELCQELTKSLPNPINAEPDSIGELCARLHEKKLSVEKAYKQIDMSELNKALKDFEEKAKISYSGVKDELALLSNWRGVLAFLNDRDLAKNFVRESVAYSRKERIYRSDGAAAVLKKLVADKIIAIHESTISELATFLESYYDEKKPIEEVLNAIIGAINGEKIEYLVDTEKRANGELKDALKIIEDLKAKVNGNMSGVNNELAEFGGLYDKLQKALLTDLKNDLSQVYHKNEKGEVDVRPVPDEDLKTFGEAVGTVIVTNAGKSLKKNGLGLTIESAWKLKYGRDVPLV